MHQLSAASNHPHLGADMPAALDNRLIEGLHAVVLEGQEAGLRLAYNTILCCELFAIFQIIDEGSR